MFLLHINIQAVRYRDALNRNIVSRREGGREPGRGLTSTLIILTEALLAGKLSSLTA